MIHRANNVLNDYSKLYPNAWRLIDSIREGRATEFPNWSNWCYAPMGAWYAIVSEQHQAQKLTTVKQIADIATMAALGAWRVTQGIYRFDPALYDAIVETKISGDLPSEVLYRLPEWCVYIETPGLKWIDKDCLGVFVHLEEDSGSGQCELRFVFDCEGVVGNIPLHIGNWSLDESLRRMSIRSKQNAVEYEQATGIAITYDHEEHLNIASQCLEPFVSLVLYLCSQNAEIGDGVRQPAYPQPQKTKKGFRIFAPDKPTTWNVGLRIGSALRRAYHEEQTHLGGTHSTPRPHIRRAHWHAFWSGSRKEEENRKRQIKWLAPIAVNVDLGDIVATVHPLK